MPLLIDAHEDLAWNALTFGRDYTRAALATREIEQRDNSIAPHKNGHTLLGVGDYLLGHVAVIFGTLFASPARSKLGEWDAQHYTTPQHAHQLYTAQLDYYARLVDQHASFQRIRTRRELESVLTSWEGEDLTRRRIGLVTLMEGADGIREPKEVEWWMERGVRIIGLAWAGTRYAGGTGEPGPLTPLGRQLLDEMANLGLILDLSHASDESYLEAVDRYPGVVIASHANPRALIKNPRRPERFLTDEMIRRLAERDGVIGVVPFNRFIVGGWTSAEGKAAVTLSHLIAMIDHICQVTGSVRHVALGSDFDGGFGVEHVPAEIDTIADLQLLDPALRARGYSEQDVAAIFNGNWLQILRRGLPA